MNFEQQLAITIIDKAIIGGILLLVTLWVNRRLEEFKHDLGIDTAQHQLAAQAHIQFMERQLSEFYGPIYGLLKRIRPIDDLWNAGSVHEIEKSIREIIRDSNNRIVDIIITRSHLIRGQTIPLSYTLFLTHVAVWHAFWDQPTPNWGAYQKIREAQYDKEFEEEIFRTTEDLKRELDTLYRQKGLMGSGMPSDYNSAAAMSPPTRY